MHSVRKALNARNVMSKVPAVTIGFWIIKVIKVFATTLGETAGDALTMTRRLGYLVGTVIFAVVSSDSQRRGNKICLFVRHRI